MKEAGKQDVEKMENKMKDRGATIVHQNFLEQMLKKVIYVITAANDGIGRTLGEHTMLTLCCSFV